MFQVEVPGGSVVRLDDLPIEVLGDAARAGDQTWYEVYDGPLADDRSALALYRACCAHAGVEAPDVVNVPTLFAAFKVASDDLPTMWEDGVPKGDAPTTSSSSTPSTTSA